VVLLTVDLLLSSRMKGGMDAVDQILELPKKAPDTRSQVGCGITILIMGVRSASYLQFA
jgi:hypothetical protein